MLTITRVLCSDNIVRYSRTFAHPLKEHDLIKTIDKNISKEAIEFDETFRTLSKQFLGIELYFSCRGWTKRKLNLILTTLQNLEKNKIETKTYLTFIFERQKKYPRSIWPTIISSQKSVREFLGWKKKFISENQIHKTYIELGLDEIFNKNNSRYLYYSKKLGWSDADIFRLKCSEFDPLFVLSTPTLMEEYKKQSDSLSPNYRKQFDEAVNFVFSDREVGKTFFDESRRLKACQVQMETRCNLTSSISQK